MSLISIVYCLSPPGIVFSAGVIDPILSLPGARVSACSTTEKSEKSPLGGDGARSHRGQVDAQTLISAHHVRDFDRVVLARLDTIAEPADRVLDRQIDKVEGQEYGDQRARDLHQDALAPLRVSGNGRAPPRPSERLPRARARLRRFQASEKRSAIALAGRPPILRTLSRIRSSIGIAYSIISPRTSAVSRNSTLLGSDPAVACVTWISRK